MVGMKSQDWLDAQNSVVGSMLISPELVPKILSQVSDSDFSGGALAVVQAIRHLFAAGSPIDSVTVRDKLGANYTSFIMQLMEITPTAANWQYYVDLCKKQARIVKLQEIGSLLAAADTQEEQQALLEQAIAVNSARQGIKAISFQDALLAFIDRHSSETPPTYLRWPIRELNDMLFVEKGDFIILGGRPSAGKTAWALQCAWTLSETLRVGFFSFETGEKKLTDRQVAAICGIPLENIKRNAMNAGHWESVMTLAGSAAAGRTLEIITESGLQADDIQAFSKARQYDVIFLDYLQIISVGRNDRYNLVTNLSISLHRFSQSSECTVIGLSQLTRPGEQRGNQSPTMSALKESGQLEQDADAVLLLYLEDEKNPNGRRVLKCAKNKEGERFKMLLDFDGKTQRFSKAHDPGGVQRQIAQMAKETKRKERMQQMTLLPSDTPVPF
ncbi:MAG: replicative DNA helicase [Firmicutes bacterium]|nr:replicative DNA helicase [Bacillota bacterium]